MEQLYSQISAGFANAVQVRLEKIIELSPFILGAVAVLLLGWILAEVVAHLIVTLGHKIKLELLAEKLGLKHFLERQKSKLTPSEVVAKGVKGYLIFLFFIEATRIAKLTQVADFLTNVISFIPEVIIAIFIMLVGIRIGHTLQLIISTSLSFTKSNTANVLGIAAKSTIVTFAILAALAQLQIAEILVQILFIGFISMLTIAGGLAFGLGGKDIVHGLLQDIKNVELKKTPKTRSRK